MFYSTQFGNILMKIYTMKQLENCTERDVEGIVEQRTEKFIQTLSKALKGQTIEAFGKNQKGLWDDCTTTHTFSIKNVKLYGNGYVYVDGDNVSTSLDIALKGYTSSFVDKHGLMYTDKRAEQAFKKLFHSLLGNQAKVSWSEQGMQGDDYVNIDFSFPLKLVAPDVAEYYKVKRKYDDLLAQADKNVNSTGHIERTWSTLKKKKI